MSYIPEKLWKTEFPTIPMPPNCTYWQFVEAVKRKEVDLQLEQSIKYITDLKQKRDRSTSDTKKAAFTELINLELRRIGK